MELPIFFAAINWIYKGIMCYKFEINIFLPIKIVFVLASGVDPVEIPQSQQWVKFII